MYNIMDEEDFTAWGTEMIQEETLVDPKKHERRFQPDIQRLEQRTCEYARMWLGGSTTKRWSDYVTTSTHP